MVTKSSNVRYKLDDDTSADNDVSLTLTTDEQPQPAQITAPGSDAPDETPTDNQATVEGEPSDAYTGLASVPRCFAPGVEKRRPGPLRGNNRRQHQRTHVVLPYRLAYADTHSTQARCQGYTEDICVGGISINAPVNIPLGSHVAIRVDVVMCGLNTRIVATGKIAYHTFSAKCGGFRYGIQFIHIREEYLETIQSLQQAIARRML